MKLACCLVVALVVPAGADEVLLRNGGRLVGQVVHRTSNAIVFAVEDGQVTLPLAHVESLTSGPTPLGLYKERAARLEANDATGWLELAQWADGERLDRPSRHAYEQVLRADPGNVAANQALGHVSVDGRWLTADEAYEARGYVRFQNRWVRPEERDAALRERVLEDARESAREARLAAEAEVKRAQAEAREAEARAREAELRAKKAEEESARRRPDCRRSVHQSPRLLYGIPREGVIYSFCEIGGQRFLCEGAPERRFHRACGGTHVVGSCPLSSDGGAYAHAARDESLEGGRPGGPGPY